MERIKYKDIATGIWTRLAGFTPGEEDPMKEKLLTSFITQTVSELQDQDPKLAAQLESVLTQNVGDPDQMEAELETIAMLLDPDDDKFDR